MFQCENCNKFFKFNYLLSRHQNNKNGCKMSNQIKIIYNKINDIDSKILDKNNNIKNIINDINNKNIKYNDNKCSYCNKIFTNKHNLIRHKKYSCIKLKELNDNKILLEQEINTLEILKNELLEEKKLQIHEEENNQLRNMVIKLLKKKSTNINITNNNKITNNNNLMLNVNINSFGNESLSHITKNDYKKFLSGLFPGFIKFIEKIHFDENAPENHNICITNMKSKYMCIYDGDWITKDKKETIDRFISKKYDLLVDKYDELEESNEIDEKISRNFRIFSENYKDHEAQKNTKNDIMLMIYNNKNKIKFK